MATTMSAALQARPGNVSGSRRVFLPMALSRGVTSTEVVVATKANIASLIGQCKKTPAELWFSTGIKAVDHSVEQLCNLERAPFSDALAEGGLKHLSKGLPESKKNPEDLDARLEAKGPIHPLLSTATDNSQSEGETLRPSKTTGARGYHRLYPGRS